MSFLNGKEVMIGANSELYHAQFFERGTPDFKMSSGALREFSFCPSRWRNGYESPDSKAKRHGSLQDCLLLTPSQMEDRYLLRPATYVNAKGETKKWSGNSTVCKQWLEDHEGMEVVTQVEIDGCQSAIKRLSEDEVIQAWLAACETQVWLTADWEDQASGLVIPCRALVDFRPRLDSEFAKCLGDFKTTRSAAMLPWQRWCFSAGYHVQAAFYSDIYAAAHPEEDRNTWIFILQENFPPWQPGKRMLSQDFLELGRATYKQMLANYCACLKANKWPGYDDTDESIQGWSLVNAEPFMAERAMFAPRYDFDEHTEEAPKDDGVEVGMAD